MIQPIHLIAYYIIIGSAFRFATENLLYTVIALWIISQLDKILKNLFSIHSEEVGSVETLNNTTIEVDNIENQ